MYLSDKERTCISQIIYMNILKEFFGIGGYQRPAEGYMSSEHLIFVSSLTLVMILCAVIFALKNRESNAKAKNRILIVSAILIDSIELFKIIIFSVRGGDPWSFVYNLPLFLCSIQLITIPIAAFSKGRIKEASLDFIAIFGLLGAILGTYFAGNNYSVYPVISIDNMASGFTHCIAGFVSIYVLITGAAKMKKENIPVTLAVLGSFCIAAYIANIYTDCNYMFLSRGDGTPYDIAFNLVGGNPVLYPLFVIALFVVYIFAFYFIYHMVKFKLRK